MFQPKRKSPRTQDDFADIIRWKKLEFDTHNERCAKIYDDLNKCKNDPELYQAILNFAKTMVRERLIFINDRLKKSLSRIVYLLNDITLFIFFTDNHIKINSKTRYFILYLDPTEDMTMLYIRGDYCIGDSVKEKYIFKEYQSLQLALSDYILAEMNNKSKSWLRKQRKGKRASVPPTLSRLSSVNDMQFAAFNS